MSKYELKPIPCCAGIGLRAEHYQDVINTHPDIGWFEVHSENYFGKGGKPHFYLDLIRQDYPLSFHGVGLSLGSTDELNILHLSNLKNIIERYSPTFISEHLCWSSIDGNYFNDLLPIPYTEEALNHFIKRINYVQDYLNRQILIENISSYLQFNYSLVPEYEFLNALANQTGCGILLDINNLYVNSINHGWNVKKYIDNISVKDVQEIHLAGFTEKSLENGSIIIDSHDKPVADKVWQLYSLALQRLGRKPTLIEWDKDLPSLDTLIGEADKANRILENTHVTVA